MANISESGCNDEDDSCNLLNPTERDILNNLERRFYRKQIYTKVAKVLIAVNPFEEIDGLYSNETKEKYKHPNMNDLTPHIYAVGNDLINTLKNYKRSKTVLLTGESGSGKSMNTKKLLHYVSKAFESEQFSQRLLFLNPVLELFGNAKTLMNSNSSRFCKFLQISCPKPSEISAKVSTYFLETSRFCVQNIGESNFHIFYVILSQSSIELRRELNLYTTQNFKYLGESPIKCYVSENSFKCLDMALKNFGYSDNTQIYKLIASVLHLGNIEIEESNLNMGSNIRDTSLPSLEYAACLMNTTPSYLKQILLTRNIRMNNGKLESISMSAPAAEKVRNSLAKAIYKYIYQHIIDVFNGNVEKSIPYIGIFDIAGFEYFENQNNCFEQLCINYTNERFQQLFVEKMLKIEQEWYQKEEINVPEIPFFDNSHIVDLFDQKYGLFPLLQDECNLRQPKQSNYVLNIQTHCSKNRAFFTSSSNLSCFTINHYARAVKYSTECFIEKNGEVTKEAIRNIIDIATKDLNEMKCQPSKISPRNVKQMTVCSSLKREMDMLIAELMQHENIFIRCIKPNDESKHATFNANYVAMQLKCSSIVEYQKLMQQGFPVQIEYNQLMLTYKVSENTIIQRHSECLDILLRSIGLSRNDFKIGNNRIFFRPVKNLNAILYPQMDEILKVKVIFEKKLAALINWTKFAKILLKANLLRSYYKNASENKIEDDQVISNKLTKDNKLVRTRNRRACIDAEETQTKTAKKEREEMPSYDMRFDQYGHFPALDKKPVRCKMEKCSLKSNYFCLKCKVHLCIKSNNCFVNFHTLKQINQQ